jgi:hypothetical protein
MRTVDELTRRLIQSGLCPPDKLIGCTDRELRQIEATIGRALPLEYRAIMGAIGRGAGDFSSDVLMFYPQVLTNTVQMKEIIESYKVKLPDSAYVFAQRYGEQCLFFQLDGTDPDPPVNRWSDDRPKRFKKVFDSVWDFIEEDLSAHEQLLQDDSAEEDEG